MNERRSCVQICFEAPTESIQYRSRQTGHLAPGVNKRGDTLVKFHLAATLIVSVRSQGLIIFSALCTRVRECVYVSVYRRLISEEEEEL